MSFQFLRLVSQMLFALPQRRFGSYAFDELTDFPADHFYAPQEVRVRLANNHAGEFYDTENFVSRFNRESKSAHAVLPQPEAKSFSAPISSVTFAIQMGLHRPTPGQESHAAASAGWAWQPGNSVDEHARSPCTRSLDSAVDYPERPQLPSEPFAHRFKNIAPHRCNSFPNPTDCVAMCSVDDRRTFCFHSVIYRFRSSTAPPRTVIDRFEQLSTSIRCPAFIHMLRFIYNSHSG